MSTSDRSAPPGTWAPARRAVHAIAAPIQRILAVEAASGIVLLVATAIALVWANVGQSSYEAVLHTPLGGRIGPWIVEHPLHFWINDGLMTVFFFVVGLEIRREMYEGQLEKLKTAALPLAAALGGMLVPAIIFAALNTGRAGEAGWAIPMATDIAFAVGALTLLGARVPGSLRILLLALAVIDDIGAIVVIAVFYSGGLDPHGVVVIAIGLGAVVAMRMAGVRAPLLYLAPGLVVWAGFSITGIHPTIGGVLLGLATPVRSWFGPSGFEEATRAQLEGLPDADREALLSRLDLIEEARREAVSPVERLIHALHPWVAFVVMPVFALANAGVVLGGAQFSGDYVWLFAGIVAGLLLGKPLGITIATLGASKIGVAEQPDNVSPRGVMLVGLVGGVGFTMSLFIAQLAFPTGPLLATAKLAILVGSGAVMVLAQPVGRLLFRR